MFEMKIAFAALKTCDKRLRWDVHVVCNELFKTGSRDGRMKKASLCDLTLDAEAGVNVGFGEVKAAT